MNIMIVDDSLTVRMDLDEAFRAAGFSTSLCASAADARRTLALSQTDLVVLDVLLPDGDGISLLRELRNAESTSKVPVLLLSSADEVADRLRGLAQGAHEFVGKPYDAVSVVRRAARLLKEERENAVPESASLDALILVIDDSPTYRNELTACLLASNYQVIQASSAEEGLQIAADIHPNAIIVDGIMPTMSGAAFLQKLRLDPGLSRTLCLLLTGADEPESEVAALEGGADAYARKKDGLDVLLARLRAMLRSAEKPSLKRVGASLLSPKRVLAVDDSVTYLERLADELRSEGYDVVRARSGVEALALLKGERVDCVVLDLLMPGLSGKETCQKIKADHRLRDTPVIILTSNDTRDAIIEGINAGADDYVGKSATFDVIKARLLAQLRRKQIEDENREIRDSLLRKETETIIAQEVADARKDLLDKLSEQNEILGFHVAELRRVNLELQSFAYSVSHDLRQPLRGLTGFSRALLDRYGDKLDEQGKHYLERIHSSGERMGRLVDGLLVLSRVSQSPLESRAVPAGKIARKILQSLQESEPGRKAEIDIDESLVVRGDPNLMESVLQNLLANAWKFTRERELTHITFGREGKGYFVRDNGAGFDMAQADRLFGAFQRFHSASRFEGTGVGLATVQRIIHRHGGKIWAESELERGTTFFFTLAEGASIPPSDETARVTSRESRATP
jgi:two-component system NtrC family sensor kinase